MAHSVPFIAGALRSSATRCLIALDLVLWAAPGWAADLTIRLRDRPKISRRIVEYQCDARSAGVGVPSGRFSVEYINAGPNSLVIVPISGHALIFSAVVSASGVRYTARQYTWWDAKGAVTVYSHAMDGDVESSCHRVDRK